MAEKTIRAFLAINLPDEVRAYLGELSRELDKQVPARSVRWVKPDRMHLTLRFLGETDVALIPELRRAVDDATKRHQPFTLQLKGFGCFPDCTRPRVLWAGIHDEEEAAIRLKRDIDKALSSFGWEPEKRPFRPHLTLGRIKDSRKLASQQWPADVKPLAIPVSSIHLIESKLRPEGPIYTLQHSSLLNAA